MVARDQEGVAGEEGADVQESADDVVLIDDRRRLPPATISQNRQAPIWRSYFLR